MVEDYRALVKRRALDLDGLVQLTFKGVLSDRLPWRQVIVRPVTIKGRAALQFAHFDARRDVTKNYAGAEAEAHLDALLALPFSSITLRTTDEHLSVQITRRGRAILHRAPAAAPPPALAHDAAKALPLPAGRPDPFLHALGIMTADGRVKARMQDKFTQINEFLKLLEHTGALERIERRPLQVLDCGAGAAYLTFAVYHYLTQVRGIPTEIVGVDANAALTAKNAATSAALALPEVCFVPSRIVDYQPKVTPDVVLALHACDTATDEALAQGIRWGASLIMAAPCCHRHLHDQLQARAPFEPLLRHGILKQRFADLLTDSLRALILRVMGYKTDVVEFVSSEHTDRNLMIRAVRRLPPGDRRFVQEYRDLTAYWGVKPHLETLLGDLWARAAGG